MHMKQKTREKSSTCILLSDHENAYCQERRRERQEKSGDIEGKKKRKLLLML